MVYCGVPAPMAWIRYGLDEGIRPATSTECHYEQRTLEASRNQEVIAVMESPIQKRRQRP